MHQCLNIFWEATSTITDTWKQKALSNAIIATHTFAHHIHIRTQQLTQTSNLVHERNLGCQETIRCIFSQLRTTGIHVHHGIALAYIRRIQFIHHIKCALVFGTNHHAIRLHKVVHSHTLTQELRVTHHIKLSAIVGANRRFYFIGCTNWHCAFVYNHLVFSHDFTQVVSHAQHVFQISRTTFARRGWQCQKDYLCVFYRLFQIVCKA